MGGGGVGVGVLVAEEGQGVGCLDGFGDVGGAVLGDAGGEEILWLVADFVAFGDAG